MTLFKAKSNAMEYWNVRLSKKAEKLSGLQRQRNMTTPLTLNDAGGGQNHPLVRKSDAISHRIMFWSQKFLTLSINCSTRMY